MEYVAQLLLVYEKNDGRKTVETTVKFFPTDIQKQGTFGFYMHAYIRESQRMLLVQLTLSKTVPTVT